MIIASQTYKEKSSLVVKPEGQVRGSNVVPLLMGTELPQRNKCSITHAGMVAKKGLYALKEHWIIYFNGLIIRYTNYIKKIRDIALLKGEEGRIEALRPKVGSKVWKKLLLEIIYKMHKSHACSNSLQHYRPNKSDIPTSLMKFWGLCPVSTKCWQ